MKLILYISLVLLPITAVQFFVGSASTQNTSENLPADVKMVGTGILPGQENIPKAIFQDEETQLMEQLIAPWIHHYTNQYRKQNGLDTLLYDDCLQKAAVYHTNYLYNEARVTNQFKLVHEQTPASKWFTGKTPSDRALAAGCKKYCGENALYLTLPNPTDQPGNQRAALNAMAKKIAYNMVFERWHASSGHRANMLTAGYTTLGVSVAIAKQITGSPDDPSSRMIAFGLQLMAY